ncbi:MAG: hypothetical protein A2133_05700 [Actinobacteria bacterium RBG_16_64_13]|nr:MAG: hypothetical protein A2133_05700 [Actinobacteria bacterium RBG_16_64_13]
MLQIVLLAGKFAFLIILYLFIYRVVRSSTRELRMSAPGAGKQQWSEAGGTLVPGGGPAAVAATSADSGTWALIVEKSPSVQAGTVFAFPPGVHAIAGRSSDMDIYLDDTFVSSKHALFETTPSGLQVEDLHSTNGTQVNGAEVAGTRLLKVGDRVEVGDTIFKVEVR